MVLKSIIKKHFSVQVFSLNDAQKLTKCYCIVLLRLLCEKFVIICAQFTEYSHSIPAWFIENDRIAILRMGYGVLCLYSRSTLVEMTLFNKQQKFFLIILFMLLHFFTSRWVICRKGGSKFDLSPSELERFPLSLLWSTFDYSIIRLFHN